VSIMLQLLKQCFPDRLNTPQWQHQLKEMIPSYGESLADDANLLKSVRAMSNEVLGIKSQTVRAHA
jgi:malate dehydrogenase (quinone)